MPTVVDPLNQALGSVFDKTTPVRLWLLLSLLWACALLFCGISAVTVLQHKHAAVTVGIDSAPSVIEAHGIKVGVEAMDNDLGMELLHSSSLPHSVQPPESSPIASVPEFELHRQQVCKDLVAAAKNITYGSAEQIPIENIQVALGEFEMHAQAARDMHDLNRESDALEDYRAAFKTVQDKLIPAADALSKANADVLEATYGREKSASSMTRGLVLVFGLVLLCMLLYTQIYVMSRFKRRLNVPLIIAMICTALFLRYLTVAMEDSSNQLKIAKEDAYNSILSLLDARADSYFAKAAETKSLLDSEHQAEHQNAFAASSGNVATFNDGYNYMRTATEVQKQLAKSGKLMLSGFSGSLADELNNVRFPGEGDAALETLSRFGEFCAVDSAIRQLQNSGNHSAAVALASGYDPNGSNFKFSRYDDALQRTIRINETEMEHAARKSTADLHGLFLMSIFLFMLIVLCSYWGLRPRLAEYSTSSYVHKNR